METKHEHTWQKNKECSDVGAIERFICGCGAWGYRQPLTSQFPGRQIRAYMNAPTEKQQQKWRESYMDALSMTGPLPQRRAGDNLRGYQAQYGVWKRDDE